MMSVWIFVIGFRWVRWTPGAAGWPSEPVVAVDWLLSSEALCHNPWQRRRQ